MSSGQELRQGKEATSQAAVSICKLASGVDTPCDVDLLQAFVHQFVCIFFQVLELWQRRQILAKSVLKPALDLLSKMRAEHEAAAAAAAMSAYKMGQPLVPRRPLRLVMPFASLDSDTRLPTHTACFSLDQWGSLAGFRSVIPFLWTML